MEKHHFKQAKFWLEGARYCLIIATEESEKYNVTVAMAIHAIIKANDALTVKFFDKIARHHDEAKSLFGELVTKNKIDSLYASYKNIIQEAISQKAKAEYRVAYFSKADAESMIRKAEKFVKMVETVLG